MTGAGAQRGGTAIPEWSVGDRLRKIRRLIGVNQSVFSEKLGVDAKTYSNWEADRHPPASMVAIAQRLELLTGVPAWWILGLQNPSPEPPTPTTDEGQDEEVGSNRRDTEFMQRRRSQMGHTGPQGHRWAG